MCSIRARGRLGVEIVAELKCSPRSASRRGRDRARRCCADGSWRRPWRRRRPQHVERIARRGESRDRLARLGAELLQHPHRRLDRARDLGIDLGVAEPRAVGDAQALDAVVEPGGEVASRQAAAHSRRARRAAMHGEHQGRIVDRARHRSDMRDDGERARRASCGTRP